MVCQSLDYKVSNASGPKTPSPRTFETNGLECLGVAKIDVASFNIAFGGADKTDARTVTFSANRVASANKLAGLRDKLRVQFERNRHVGHQDFDIGDVERVRGQKEDLKAQQAAPYAAPGKKIKRLWHDAEAKKGSLKMLCISCDVIRLSTKPEIMSIQERCTREKAKLINRKEKWLGTQEQWMQVEMNSGMHTTQLAS
ncbi:hypothetical protein BX661DRAFT_195466 [Kickxella alabastrina]|uniref:uncharacterized protein n=1 Tax=Kickxella alabastrina TaxID=61397 RepID=UPI00221E3818|nr:uncharacterized protein BX661DRAFT_195466 [Kickxella alabastrina]KAI7834899.1 hypothetical protein BX661DRAFT_195466 [Kickxella alabastrina]